MTAMPQGATPKEPIGSSILPIRKCHHAVRHFDAKSWRRQHATLGSHRQKTFKDDTSTAMLREPGSRPFANRKYGGVADPTFHRDRVVTLTQFVDAPNELELVLLHHPAFNRSRGRNEPDTVLAEDLEQRAVVELPDHDRVQA